MKISPMNLKGLICGLAPMLFLAANVTAQVDPVWQNLSSKRGELPTPPGGSPQQTGAAVADFDNDGFNDFIISSRQKGPSLVLYRRTSDGWDAHVIETNNVQIEAGGAVCDIDGDGYLDVVFGEDWSGDKLYWWQNPGPGAAPNATWKRHLITSGREHQFHDQMFGDFLGTGKPQLVFWNNLARKLYLAEIPDDPRNAPSWPVIEVATVTNTASAPYPEGLFAFDVDGDGRLDIIAYDTWYKYVGDKKFKAVKFAKEGGRVAAGYFKPSKIAQIVVSSGDGDGPLKWYECTGNPESPADWVGHDLLDRSTIHAHSLKVGDINRDGYLDIFCAEMAKWLDYGPQKDVKRDNLDATAWAFYGDGQGNFTKKEIVQGHGWHETQLADLDGDGDLDLLNKPYFWDTPRVDVWLNNGTRHGANGVGTTSDFHGPVGLQLYSLRDILGTNVEFGLQLTRNYGFKEVELAGTYGLSPEQMKAELSWYGLKPISGIWEFDQFANHLDDVIKQAKTLGLHYVGNGWIPHGDPMTKADIDKAAVVFNRAGEACAKEGIKFFYHPHGFEFVAYNGGTLLDELMAQTKPGLVNYEMDVFWIIHPGFDPVKLLEKYPDRWVLMHLKDLRKGMKTGAIDANEDIRNNVPVGSGQLDLPAILHEAQKIGIQHYFIEDESPIAPQQIPQSLRNLETLTP